MDARHLNHADRERLKAALLARRTQVDELAARMQAARWYSTDTVYQCVLAAQAALHAAVNHVISLPPEVLHKPAPKPPFEMPRPTKRG
jgi:hypothetical protein